MQDTCRTSGCIARVRPKHGKSGRPPKYCTQHANDRHASRPQFCMRCLGPRGRGARRSLCQTCVADRKAVRTECRAIVLQMKRSARKHAAIDRNAGARNCRTCSRPFRSTVGHTRCDRCRRGTTGLSKTRRVPCMDCHDLTPARKGKAVAFGTRCERCKDRRRIEGEAKKLLKQIMAACPPDIGTCYICGETFERTQPHQRRCTSKCTARTVARRCIICERDYVPKSATRPENVCSDDCGVEHKRRIAAAYRRSASGREQSRRAKDRRRARKRNAFVANVSRSAIYERDKWTCQLCGKRVLKSKVVPHPRAPVLDHIVPLAKGGTHEPANVQLACFLCNSVKSDNPAGEQLRLLG